MKALSLIALVVVGILALPFMIVASALLLIGGVLADASCDAADLLGIKGVDRLRRWVNDTFPI
jgi:hypothetical protein